MKRVSWTIFVFLFACSSSNPPADGGDGSVEGGDENAVEGGACQTLSAAGIHAGATHACARKSDGSMLCWGINTRGATGDGTTDGEPCLSLTAQCRLTPVVAKIGSVADVSPGDAYTCVRKMDNTVWCFGTNGYGELGDGTIVGPDCMGFCRTAPAQVTTLGTVISLSAASRHACAVKSDGTVWCWGANDQGQLGDGTTNGQMCGGLPCRPTPQQVMGVTSAVEVASGYVHSCARKADGTVWCWGDDNNGQLGDNMMGGAPKAPVQAGIANAVEIGVGDSTTCARKMDNTVWCWGEAQQGALGTGATMDTAVPVQVTGVGATVAQLAVGRNTACVRKDDGTAWCWGRDTSGQIGNGQTKGSGCSGGCEPMPVQVAGLNDAADISVGDDFACARKKDGTVVCWGNRLTGELGCGMFHGNFSCGNAICEPSPIPACLN